MESRQTSLPPGLKGFLAFASILCGLLLLFCAFAFSRIASLQLGVLYGVGALVFLTCGALLFRTPYNRADTPDSTESIASLRKAGLAVSNMQKPEKEHSCK